MLVIKDVVELCNHFDFWENDIKFSSMNFNDKTTLNIIGKEKKEKNKNIDLMNINDFLENKKIKEIYNSLNINLSDDKNIKKPLQFVQDLYSGNIKSYFQLFSFSSKEILPSLFLLQLDKEKELIVLKNIEKNYAKIYEENNKISEFIISLGDKSNEIDCLILPYIKTFLLYQYLKYSYDIRYIPKIAIEGLKFEYNEDLEFMLMIKNLKKEDYKNEIFKIKPYYSKDYFINNQVFLTTLLHDFKSINDIECISNDKKRILIESFKENYVFSKEFKIYKELVSISDFVNIFRLNHNDFKPLNIIDESCDNILNILNNEDYYNFEKDEMVIQKLNKTKENEYNYKYHEIENFFKI